MPAPKTREHETGLRRALKASAKRQRPAPVPYKKLTDRWVKRAGEMSKPPTSEQLFQFFWRIRIDDVTGCWVWKGQRTGGGSSASPIFPECPAGPARLPGARPAANRISWAWFRGKLMPWPHWTVARTCADRMCVNPDHLQQKRNESRRALPPPNTEQLARFFGAVRVEPSGCWAWTGERWDNGYARFAPDGKSARAGHRVAFEWFVAPLSQFPAHWHVDHACYRRECVNPAHLECLAPHENFKRRMEQRRRAEAASMAAQELQEK